MKVDKWFSNLSHAPFRTNNPKQEFKFSEFVVESGMWLGHILSVALTFGRNRPVLEVELYEKPISMWSSACDRTTYYIWRRHIDHKESDIDGRRFRLPITSRRSAQSQWLTGFLRTSHKRQSQFAVSMIKLYHQVFSWQDNIWNDDGIGKLILLNPKMWGLPKSQVR